jgi:hypothetical protein
VGYNNPEIASPLSFVQGTPYGGEGLGPKDSFGGVRRICIITPGTIASNPRVVKEAEALSEAGYKVHLIYTRHVDYLVERDQAILNEHPDWTADYLDWCSSGFKSRAIKYFSGIKKRASGILNKSKIYPDKLAPFLINRFYFWQLKKAIDCKADLYIAHYPDSLGIALRAAKANNTYFAYDAEDYHRGEDLPASELKIISEVEDSTLPFARYISAASPLMADEYRRLFPMVPVVPIENMFLLRNQPAFINIPDKVFKFFWFSQTIGPKRGLEEFISILGHTNKKNILLSLLGNIRESYRRELTSRWTKEGLLPESLVFINTVSEKKIFEIASSHHFGLCLEIPSVLNKDVCLSNKLFTYILSGNFLILSHTKAQKNFHTNFPETGVCIELENTLQSAEKINELFRNSESIEQTRQSNFLLGQTKLNFDREKEILIRQVNSLWE